MADQPNDHSKATVSQLRPTKINEDNIPHMLRDLASKYERGEHPMPQTIFVVSITEGDRIPAVDHFGAVGHPIFNAGALHMAAQMYAQDMIDEVTDDE